MNAPIIESVHENNLDFLQATPATLTSDIPIILIHGAYNNGYIFKDSFLSYFAQHGFVTYALHLKNPKDDHAAQTLYRYSLEDYVTKAKTFIQYLNTPCLVLGHSMGGFIVQKLINEHTSLPIKAAFLLASVSPFGIARAIRANTLQNFTNGLKYAAITLYPKSTKLGIPPTGLFSENCPIEIITKAQPLMIRESLPVLLGLIKPKLKLRSNLKTKVFVIGAGKDELVLPMDVLETANAYQVPYKMFPKMGHAMTLEPSWPEVADFILAKIRSVIPMRQLETMDSA